MLLPALLLLFLFLVLSAFFSSSETVQHLEFVVDRMVKRRISRILISILDEKETSS